jgi:hypothetical protein
VGDPQGAGSKPPDELEKGPRLGWRRRVARLEAQLIVWIAAVVGLVFLIVLVLRLVHAI